MKELGGLPPGRGLDAIWPGELKVKRHSCFGCFLADPPLELDVFPRFLSPRGRDDGIFNLLATADGKPARPDESYCRMQARLWAAMVTFELGRPSLWPDNRFRSRALERSRARLTGAEGGHLMAEPSLGCLQEMNVL